LLGALGVSFGIATLVRPQLLLLAPVFGALAAPEGGPSAGVRKRLLAAGITTALAVAVCLPWMARNCKRMDRCVFVSANAGWNLLIGVTEGATGSWVSIEGERVPRNCRDVHGEAGKDRCFGAAALDQIASAPLRFIALTPAKLGVTFDYAGAAGWYLHASNPAAFDERHKRWLGALETLWQRLILGLGLLAAVRADGPRVRARLVVAALAALFLFVRAAWLAHVGLVLVTALLGRAVLRHPPAALAAASVAATALAHAVFFGAGRYSLVCFAVLGALAGSALKRPTF
jgi:hypothetical protein